MVKSITNKRVTPVEGQALKLNLFAVKFVHCNIVWTRVLKKGGRHVEGAVS